MSRKEKRRAEKSREEQRRAEKIALESVKRKPTARKKTSTMPKAARKPEDKPKAAPFAPKAAPFAVQAASGVDALHGRLVRAAVSGCFRHSRPPQSCGMAEPTKQKGRGQSPDLPTTTSGNALVPKH